MAAAETGILVLGAGNAYRSDDGVGLVVARRLRDLGIPGVAVTEVTGEGAALLDAWKDARHVFLVDAVHASAAPGTVYRLDARSGPVPAKFFHYSTHAFGVAESIELARALNQLPPSLIVYGIEGGNFQAGTGLSPAVDKAAHGVAGRIAEELAALGSQC